MTESNIKNFAPFNAVHSHEFKQGGGFDSIDPFIRRPEVCRLTSLPSSSLTDLISIGEFPRPFKLGKRMSAWKLSEVNQWMNSRLRKEVGA